MKRHLLPFLAVLAPGLVWAGSPINQTKAVDADATIEITNVKGAVTVSGWDKPEVSVSGTLGDGSRGLSVEGGGSHLTVKVEGPDKSKNWLSWGSDSRMEESTLDLKVPIGASVEINVVSANVGISQVNGRSVQVDSVSGRVRLDSAAPRVRVDAVSGDVEFSGKAEDTNIETVSGDVQVRGVGGRVHTETVSGAIRMEATGALRDLSASTVSGDIEMRGAVEKTGRVHIESMSGDVRLRMPGDTSARLQAESFSGTLKSDFGTVQKQEHGPGSHLDARLGNADADISVETFSGDVNLLHD